ncbi:MAG: carboxypeptidase regulatory-like domain-containing protein [Vicinamibacterales bacterium]
MDRRLALTVLSLALTAGLAAAQSVRGTVVDQTGLPLPGVTVQLFDGPTLVRAVTSREDGTFDLDPRATTIVFSLDGFETVRVDRAGSERVVLPLAGATDSTTVLAPTIAPAPLTTAALGSSLAATTVARLPSTQLKARESLGLLPSVVRGADGLLRFGGARVSDTPLLIDGFNVTDPATGTSSINLPFESVRGIDLLRDPMSVTYGGLLGGLVQIDSKPGDENFKMGVQGFVPRPRFTNPNAGRLEGIFPRIYASDANRTRRARYFTSAEWDFERIPVPEVTQSGGPDVVEQSGIVFARVDLTAGARNTLTIEGLVMASGRDSESLSPRRDDQAATDTRGKDLFIGVTNRFILDPTNVLTVRFGAFDREASLTPRGAGTSSLSPEGWSGNWFSHMSRQSSRVGLTVTSEQAAVIKARLHEFTIAAGIFSRRLTGSVTEQPVLVVDAIGRLVRRVGFGPAGDTGTGTASLEASDRPSYLAARDVWHASERLQIDGGVRVDYNGSHGYRAPSGRLGLRLGLDASDRTVVKAGYGTFVGDLPLLVQAFGGYPARTDTRFDPATGATIDTLSLQPAVRHLRLPRAVTVTVGIERQIRPGLDAQVSVTERNSIRLATLDVPAQSGPLTVMSSGTGRYQELQLSVRRRFERDQQIFVSYVRSDAKGELNDFSTQFQGFDVPLVQPGGRARLSTDAPHRVIAWGTFNLPGGIVVSPVTEWRSGFPYSSLTDRYLYAGTPHDRDFPAFMATDLIVYKNLMLLNRSADLGIQLFNATNHDNPRDVYPVAGTARFGEFTNSVGPILRGFMMLKW